MQIGDLVKVEWREADLYTTAVIVSEKEHRACGFYTILCEGERRIMHSDFMRVISNNKPSELGETE
jgi:hypothetical protein